MIANNPIIEKPNYIHDMNKATIAIIEDHKTIRDNVSKYISFQDDLKVGIEASSVEHFFEQLRKYDGDLPQVLLLDIGLPGISGLEGIPLLLEQLPDLDIIMLTTYEEETKILKAICSGASSYLSKKSSLEEIMQTIRIVLDGGSYMSPSIAREIVNHLMGGRKSKAEMLSPRQKEILIMLVDGKSYQEISEVLFISFETVRSHIKNLYKVLHVNKKSAAIAMYLRGEIQ